MKKTICFLLVLLNILLFLGGCTLSDATQSDINYIINYSDNAEDCQLKDKIFRLYINSENFGNKTENIINEIKQNLIIKFSDEFNKIDSKKETVDFVEKNKQTIHSEIKKILKKYGIKKNIKIDIGNFYFPQTDYESFTLKEGEYTAIKITIGEETRYQWKCVLYPPLCFVNTKEEIIENSNSQFELKWFLSEFFK